MSELMNMQGGRHYRWQLLVGVSNFVLLASLPLADTATAHSDDADRPTVWIELGGQLQRVDGREDAFAPPFAQVSPQPGPFSPVSPIEAQRQGRYAIGGEGKISFEPEGSNWVFSAGVKYSRSNRNRLVHQQTSLKTTAVIFGQAITQTGRDFADTDVHNRASQTILDFKAGKDVGLGMFGPESQSLLSFGVRVAQISSKSKVDIHARPDFEFGPYPALGTYLPLNQRHHDYIGTATTERSFKGIGPSLSWDGSAPLLRDSDQATINFDWGVDGAILFGRQKSGGVHQTSKHSYEKKYHPSVTYGYQLIYANLPHRNDRSRSVIVPNIGGFAGFSYRFPDARLSLGYRADFFFGAVDAGVDARHTADRGFYGPYASISIGL
ncbi:MAG TPA: hypothetical protein VGM36_13450 [Rhizomicrobium sp.]|jgi:hypothetical protein